MIKNVEVVDEQGNQYESTYPRRAKGLVRNGRARFVSENRICLACPPDVSDCHPPKETNTEVRHMSNIPERPTMQYLLEQIANISSQNEHIFKALEMLNEMKTTYMPVSGSAADLAGQAKAEAIGNIATAREATNKRLLALYERMYDDLMRSERETE